MYELCLEAKIMILTLTKRRLRRITFPIISALLVVGAATADAEQLRLVTQNALNYGGQSDRLPAFRIIMRDLAPDLACMQEITNEEAVDQLLSFVFLQINDDWTAVSFHDGRDTDNAFFYRTSKLQMVSTRYIQTTLRDIAEYTLRPAWGDTALRIRVYSLHLKANAGSGDNVERRRQEALVLRGELDQMPSGSLLFVCGDYNLLTSSEPAYELLLAPTPATNGQLNDPINTPGSWESNPAFAAIHTCSSDDLNARFDFILVSNALMDTVGSYVLPSTYTACGNDGNHFGRAVNILPNTAVPDSVAQALVAASDHLPVAVDFILASEETNLTERMSVKTSFALMTCYPNPFNAATTISYDFPRAGCVSVRIFDQLGQEVTVLRDGFSEAGSHRVTFDGSRLASGIYFARLDAGKFSQTKKLMLLK
jgi:endonuclease/exonuclease/phosphatase family metal-dependent hydrolase